VIVVDLGDIDRFKTASDPATPEKEERVNKPYLLCVADPAGVFRDEQFETFDEALLAYKTWQDEMDPHNYATGERIHGYAFTVTNTDKCEADGEQWFDGLTDAEREEL